MRAERFSEVITEHGEGVGWDQAAGVVRCVDLLAGDVITLDRAGVVSQRWHVDRVAAAWRPRRGGGVVVATERGFALLADTGAVEWSVEVWRNPLVRMNDGACDPAGSFYCGSMAYDARRGAGSLWRLDPDRTVHPVLDGLTISNGLAWAPDEQVAFHVDTPTGRVHCYHSRNGLLTGRRTAVAVVGGDPDGITLDAEGGIWVALWGGSAVHRYDRAGALTAVVEVGASQVTSCAFGGESLDRLFITTSRLGLPGGSEPYAGAVFAIDPGVRGIPAYEYAG